MRILALGGPQFIGRHIVEQLLAAGHTVSVLTRGQSPDPLPAEVERLRGDRDLGRARLKALEGRNWDACMSAQRAIAAGLSQTFPEAITPEQEAELIARARRR